MLAPKKLMKDRLKKPFYEKNTMFENHYKILILKNDNFFDSFHNGAEILSYTKIHILNIVIFTRFTFPKSHFSQNSHF